MDYRRMPIEAESPEQLGYARIRSNLAESSVADTPLRDLAVELDDLVLTYGDHVGRPGLRAAIAAPAPRLGADDVLVTPGAAAALFIVHTTLLGPGDELVVVRPNYATNLETPRAIGAAVRHVDLDYADQWAVDPDRIAALMTPKTVLVSLTTPHNPTGQVMTEADLREVVRLVEAHPRARLLVDETYREMTFDGPLPLAASLSERVIGVSSLSKADGLPGIRIGWLITTDADLQGRFLAAKEQILITNSVVDEAIAEVALARRPVRLPIIMAGIATALQTVRGWFADQDLFEWVEPRGGVVGFPRFGPGIQVDVDAFYRILLDRHGTLVGPGHWFDQPRRHFRLGYGWPTAVELEHGLAALLASAVEAWDGPRVRSDRRPGAAIGNALLEMDRQIFRDVPRVEEMVKTGSETVGLSGDGGLACGSRRASRRRTPIPTISRRPSPRPTPGRPGPDRSGDGPGRVLHRGRDGQLIDGDVDVERDLLADEPAAGLERDVPVETPRLAVDLGAEMEPGMTAAAHPGDDPVEFGVERHRPGDVPDRHVRGDPVVVTARLDLRDAGDDPRIRLGVEEVRGTEVLVAGVEAGRQAGRRDPDLAAGGGRVGLIEPELAFDLVELAADRGHHHVLRGEGDVGVRRIDPPGGRVVHGVCVPSVLRPAVRPTPG